MPALVGTAGFSYRDWTGNFYPGGIRQADMLETYARHFPVVEINSTYYAIPRPVVFERMAERTGPGFRFTVKANREMTHLREGSPGVFGRFIQAIEPLIERGRLGCVLAQFPWSFKNTADNRKYLGLLAGELQGIDTVVEFRNSSFEDGAVFSLLEELKLGYCCVDEPRLKGLVSARVERTGPVAYLRFHGRNRANWWDRNREPWERYDYLYSEEELAGWLPGAAQLENGADRLYVIFNNHYKGQAPANAAMFERMLAATLGDRVVSAPPGGETTLFD